jgi:hypothetical protein
MTPDEMGHVRQAAALLAATEVVTVAAVPALIGRARRHLRAAVQSSQQQALRGEKQREEQREASECRA